MKGNHTILAAVLLLSACAGVPAGSGGLSDEQILSFSNRLNSTDWSVRYGALLDLEPAGPNANPALLAALSDRSDIISRTAQEFLLRQGESVIPFLIDHLVTRESDRGLFARIAGGVERDRGKSVAGTLWLTLVRGMSRDRCHRLLGRLVGHPSPKVRAVVLFTAGTMRSARFLRFLFELQEDRNPLVQQIRRETCVRLLLKNSYSTPELDAATVDWVLRLLKPDIVDIFNSESFGMTEDDRTLGETLGRDPLLHHRDRFLTMLWGALGDTRLSHGGVLNTGKAIVNQADEDLLRGYFRKWVKDLPEPGETEWTPRLLTVLSVFPHGVFDLSAAEGIFAWCRVLVKKDRKEASRAPHLAARLLLQALDAGNEDVAREALVLLKDAFAGAHVMDAAAAARTVLTRTQDRATVVRMHELVGDQATRIVKLSDTESPRRLRMLMELFYRVRDNRFDQMLEKVWAKRKMTEPGLEWTIGDCVKFLSTRKYRPLIPKLLELVAEGPESRHTHLKDVAVYCLTLNRFAEFQSEFLTDKVFADWLRIIADPEEHPRFRAGFHSLLLSPNLDSAMRKKLRDLYLKLARPPNDANLRSKAAMDLARSGDRRVIPILYEIIMDPDQPWWVWANALQGMVALHGADAAGVVVDLLEAMLEIWGDEEKWDAHRIVHVNNYFNWAVQYQVYAPRLAVERLKAITKKDFGTDVSAWRTWLANQ